jgi:hypothetical protein
VAAHRAQGGKTLRLAIDLLLGVSIFIVASLLARAAMDRAQLRSEVNYAVSEARALYEGLQRYHERNGAYPATYAGPRFDPATLDPLRKKGYYKGGLLSVLLDRRVDAYDSPDDQGLNHEFWVEMTLARDPSIRFLVAHSDDAPLGDGQWVDGVFVVRDGELEAR